MHSGKKPGEAPPCLAVRLSQKGQCYSERRSSNVLLLTRREVWSKIASTLVARAVAFVCLDRAEQVC